MSNLFLAMPTTNGIYKLIIQHLKAHGFTVCDLSFSDNNDIFRHPTLREKFQIKYRKKILGDKEAKLHVISANNLKQIEQHKQTIIQTIQQNNAEHALFIRGDIYDEDILQLIRSKTRGKMINYQWDGLDRFGEIFNKLHCFDINYVFDPADVGEHNGLTTLPATNFWFDRMPEIGEIQSDVYFTGIHWPGLNRSDALVRFAQYAQAKGLKTNFAIYHIHDGGVAEHPTLYPHPSIHPIRHSKDFRDNLLDAMHSRILLDFKNPDHKGMSFRPFEALGYRKKLITTNPETAKYDFYHPSNIFIWDGKTLDGLDQFIATPYQEIDPAIREKYSFGNWIHYVLNLEPHQKITLPNSQS